MSSARISGRDTVPAVDPTYGQRSVFGGNGQTTAPVDNDLEIEDEQDALDYLRLVRAEASKIPHVMIATSSARQFTSSSRSLGAGPVDGPQPALSKRQLRRRRHRHWDDQGDGFSAKKRRIDDGQAVGVAVGGDVLSYDDNEAAGASLATDLKDEEGDRRGEGDDAYPGENEDGYAFSGYDDDGDNDIADSHGDIYTNEASQDTRGYYHDGAYTAAPDSPARGVNGQRRKDNKTREKIKGGQHPMAAFCSGVQSHLASANEEGEIDKDDDEDYGEEKKEAAFSSVYHTLLLQRFAALRGLLRPRCPPPDEVVAALPADHDIFVGPLNTRSGTFRRWLLLLQTTDPLPAQVAAMDKISVFRLLRVMLRGLLTGASTSGRSSRSMRFAQSLLGAGGAGGGHSSNRKPGLDIGVRTSRWLWALLARLPDRGELDHREVGYVRDVAKQAALRLAHLSYDVSTDDFAAAGRQGETEELAEDEEGEAYAEEEDVTGDCVKGGGGEYEEQGHEHSESRETRGEEPNKIDEDDEYLLDIAMDVESEPEFEPELEAEAGIGSNGASTDEKGEGEDTEQDEEDAEMHQRATLEMVLAVAGVFYGQRDLLAFRSPWPRATPSTD